MTLYCSKKLSVLLRGITSKYDIDFYCLNFLHSFRTKKKLTSITKWTYENKDFCNVVISSEDTKTLDFKWNHDSGKIPIIIHSDLESLIENIMRNHLQEK